MIYPKITIITPSFNQGQFIEQTIQSVINQNYPNLEYLVIDGGSTDNTVEIIKKYDKNITYWISETDKGQSDAINKGLKMATGEIINWLNSDDYYEPNALFKIAATFEQNKNTKVVCAKSRLFKNTEETVGYTNGTDIYDDNLAKTIGWARIDQPETFFHRSAIEKMGELDTELNYLMDRDWWMKYLLVFGLNNIQKTPDIIVNFRLHNNSKTIKNGKDFQSEHDSWFYAFSNTLGFKKYSNTIKETMFIDDTYQIKNITPIDLKLKEKVINYFLLLRANEFYALNNTIKTLKLLASIDVKLLQREDVKLWEKLKFRSKYIPKRILNFFRKYKL